MTMTIMPCPYYFGNIVGHRNIKCKESMFCLSLKNQTQSDMHKKKMWRISILKVLTEWHGMGWDDWDFFCVMWKMAQLSEYDTVHEWTNEWAIKCMECKQACIKFTWSIHPSNYSPNRKLLPPLARWVKLLRYAFANTRMALGSLSTSCWCWWWWWCGTFPFSFCFKNLTK